MLAAINSPLCQIYWFRPQIIPQIQTELGCGLHCRFVGDDLWISNTVAFNSLLTAAIQYEPTSYPIRGTEKTGQRHIC